ncbi:hypothetical protein V6N11_011579 [Hibiscus sabdariffa]|uniref:Uncharacterized protein n=1 Tax=Hibiscus sabdariffa TaxID=183260 RepID=A0ABR2S8Q5_9ROSI
MAARRVPEFVRCIEDNRPNQPDLEQLALNEDGNINEYGQNVTGIFKDKPKLPPLRSEGDEEEANANPKTINEEDIVILKSQETRDYESALDTSL